MQATQPLLKNLWIDSTRLNISIARNRLHFSEAGFRFSLMDIITQVENAYYDLIAAYVKKLEKSLDKQKDVIGYAVVINGKVHSADVFANADLFRKLWPKLLKCAAIEAIAENEAKAKTKSR